MPWKHVKIWFNSISLHCHITLNSMFWSRTLQCVEIGKLKANSCISPDHTQCFGLELFICGDWKAWSWLLLFQYVQKEMKEFNMCLLHCSTTIHSQEIKNLNKLRYLVNNCIGILYFFFVRIHKKMIKWKIK